MHEQTPRLALYNIFCELFMDQFNVSDHVELNMFFHKIFHWKFIFCGESTKEKVKALLFGDNVSQAEQCAWDQAVPSRLPGLSNVVCALPHPMMREIFEWRLPCSTSSWIELANFWQSWKWDLLSLPFWFGVCFPYHHGHALWWSGVQGPMSLSVWWLRAVKAEAVGPSHGC